MCFSPCLHTFHTGKSKKDFEFFTEGSLWAELYSDLTPRGLATRFEGSMAEDVLGIVIMARTKGLNDDVPVFRSNLNLKEFFNIPRDVYWVTEFAVYSYGAGPGDTQNRNLLDQQKHKFILSFSSLKDTIDTILEYLKECMNQPTWTAKRIPNYFGAKIVETTCARPAFGSGPYVIVKVQNGVSSPFKLDDLLNQDKFQALFYATLHEVYSRSTGVQVKHYLDLPQSVKAAKDTKMLEAMVDNNVGQKVFKGAILDCVKELRKTPDWNRCIWTYFNVLFTMQLSFPSLTDFSEACRRRVINVVMDAATTIAEVCIDVECEVWSENSVVTQGPLNAGHGPLDYLQSKKNNCKILFDDKSLFFGNVPLGDFFQLPVLPRKPLAAGNGTGKKRKIEPLPPISAKESDSVSSIAVQAELDLAMLGEEEEEDEGAVEEEEMVEILADEDEEGKKEEVKVEVKEEEIPSISVVEAKTMANTGFSQVAMQSRDNLLPNRAVSSNVKYCFSCLSSGQTYHFMGVHWKKDSDKPSLDFFGTLALEFFIYASGSGRKSGVKKVSIASGYKRVDYVQFEILVAAMVMMLRGTLKKHVLHEYADLGIEHPDIFD